MRSPDASSDEGGESTENRCGEYRCQDAWWMPVLEHRENRDIAPVASSAEAVPAHMRMLRRAIANPHHGMPTRNAADTADRSKECRCGE